MSDVARGSELQYFVREQDDFTTATSLLQSSQYWNLPLFNWRPQPQQQRGPDGVIPAATPTAQPQELVDGLSSLRWSTETPLAMQSIGFWLKMLMGAPTTTGTTNLTHVFNTADVPSIPAFSVVEKHTGIGDVKYQSQGCVATGMTITGRKSGQVQRVALEGVGIQHLRVTDDPDDAPVVFSANASTVDFLAEMRTDTGAGYAGVDVVRDVTLNIANGIELDQEVLTGTATPTSLLPPQWGITGNMNLRFDGSTYYIAARQKTLIDLELKWTVDANTELKIEFFDLLIDPYAPAIENDGIITQSVNFRANKPTGSNKAAIVTLKNQTADYDQL